MTLDIVLVVSNSIVTDKYNFRVTTVTPENQTHSKL